jgi:hypothetical protein
MANTTNINELPLNPVGGGGNGEMQMMASEQQQQRQDPQQQLKLDQTTINQIVNGLQAASVAGITQLPSRDIPRSVEQLTQDPQVQPNYIQPTQRDYIKESDSTEEMIRQREKTDRQDKQSEQLYDEMQTPVLLSILYFLFQLPILRKLLSQYLPVLFGTDGNININGLGFMSIAYGGCYYFLDKIMRTI